MQCLVITENLLFIIKFWSFPQFLSDDPLLSVFLNQG